MGGLFSWRHDLTDHFRAYFPREKQWLGKSGDFSSLVYLERDYQQRLGFHSDKKCKYVNSYSIHVYYEFFIIFQLVRLGINIHQFINF